MFKFQRLLAHSLHTCIRYEIVFVFVGWFSPKLSRSLEVERKAKPPFCLKETFKESRSEVWFGKAPEDD